MLLSSIYLWGQGTLSCVAATVMSHCCFPKAVSGGCLQITAVFLLQSIALGSWELPLWKVTPPLCSLLPSWPQGGTILQYNLCSAPPRQQTTSLQLEPGLISGKGTSFLVSLGLSAQVRCPSPDPDQRQCHNHNLAEFL